MYSWSAFSSRIWARDRLQAKMETQQPPQAKESERMVFWNSLPGRPCALDVRSLYLREGLPKTTHATTYSKGRTDAKALHAPKLAKNEIMKSERCAGTLVSMASQGCQAAKSRQAQTHAGFADTSTLCRELHWSWTSGSLDVRGSVVWAFGSLFNEGPWRNSHLQEMSWSGNDSPCRSSATRKPLVCGRR